jgi:hypothetical protein
MPVITARPSIRLAPTGPCTIPANGACTIPANDSCTSEKELDVTIPNLLNLSAQGYLDRIEVMWDTGISYPDQVVKMMYRDYDRNQLPPSNYYDSPKSVPRDDGIIATVNTLQPYTIFEMFIRAENPTHYGYWQRIEAITDPAWSTDSEIVIHAGEFVYHVSDIVLYDG